MADKCCPLISNTAGAGWLPCRGKTCAWYVEEVNECAVILAVRRLTYIANQLAWPAR